MAAELKQPSTWDEAARLIVAGEVGVLPTDTLYGLVGSALKPDAVARIYDLRGRDQDKPLITLIGDMRDLARFGLRPDQRWQQLLSRVWPGPVTVIFPGDQPELAYLHRGAGGISFRLPAQGDLRNLLRQAGPVVAPSANPQGQEPAGNLAEAQAYFGSGAAFYVDGGDLEGAPSAIIDGRIWPPRILRSAPGFNIDFML